MGGFFSGRWGGHRKKTCVDQCRSFSVATLVGDTPPAAGSLARFVWRDADGAETASVRFAFPTDRRVVLAYRWGDAGTPIAVSFDLVPVPTPRGGTRYLAVCPRPAAGGRCGRRVTRLYLPPGSPHFGCRHCHALTYRSRQGHDPRVTRLARGGRLPELAACLKGRSLQTLGLILSGLLEEERRFNRAAKRLGPRPKPRRRKRP